MNEGQLLGIGPICVGKSQAVMYVETLMTGIGFLLPSRKEYSEVIKYDLPGGPFAIRISDAIRETQENGIPDKLQFLFDSRDRYLAPILRLASGAPPKGVSLDLSASLGAYTKTVRVPGTIESPENAIAGDILFFRRKACEASEPSSFEECTRYYRSYLHACISLVDCFLFRYNNVVKELVKSTAEYANTKILDSVAGIEQRIDAWFETFAYHEKSHYKQSVEWAEFQKLRKLRNSFVHPSEPATGYQIAEMAKSLNLCRRGIGGLLATFRVKTHATPHIGFIHKVKTAPQIAYVAGVR